MRVQLGSHLVKIDPIEWSDNSKEEVVAFFIRCPKCYRRQWNRIADLYQAKDGSLKNVRCKSCSYGKVKRRFWGEIPNWDTASYKEFSPKCVGWKSVFRRL